MPTKDPTKRLVTTLVLTAALALTAGATTTLALQRFLGIDLGVILATFLLSMALVVTRRLKVFRVVVVVDLAAVFLATWIDHSWVSTLYSATLSALTLPITYTISKKLNPDPTISDPVAAALKAEGVVLGQSVDGWTSVTRHAQVYMLREISPGYGPPASWATPARLYNKLRPILDKTAAMGAAPTVLFVTQMSTPEVLYRGPHYHVTSQKRLSEYFREGSNKKLRQTKTRSPQRVHHDGRVTRRTPG